MTAALTLDEIHAFLDSRPGWIALTTQGKDGYPHTIPIGYFRDGDAVCMGCRAPTQKTRNIERNPRVSLMLESGSSMADIKGVVIQGDAEVITSGPELLRLAREGARRRGTPEDQLPTEPSPGAAYIRVTPKKYISWDYARNPPRR